MNSAVERFLGRMFRRVRAGDRHLVWNDARLGDAPVTLRLTSPAFAGGAAMPMRHAGIGAGDNLSPPLAWSGVPNGTAELVLIIEDPDAPLSRPVVHLIASAIAPDRPGLPEGALSPGQDASIVFGRGFAGRIGYAGPRPVRGHGPHRYIFQIFAVARRLSFAGTPDVAALSAAMAGAVLARGKLVGTYERA
jgi:Raf kinase inhibitor-like YbhB/YbcL family protein